MLCQANEIMDNVFLDCESNLNNLDTIFKYLTNYETIKNTLDNPGVELKLKILPTQWKIITYISDIL